MWDERFLALAEHVALWSKDPSTKVGAVIVDEKKRVVSLGYNGVPRGVKEVPEGDRDRKLLRTIHAEENALHFANKDVEGCTLYVSMPPCAKCAAQMIQRGVSRVVCRSGPVEFWTRWMGQIVEAKAMFDEAGVSVTIIDKEEP
jgi:dCMP deaminase